MKKSSPFYLLIVIFLAFFAPFINVKAQELNCTVVVNSKNMTTNQGAEQGVYATMQQSMAEFMNTRKWTREDFRTEEKINCRLEFTLLDGNPSAGTFTAAVQLTITRPVYATNYETNLLLFIDKSFSFRYLPSQPFDFNENAYFNDLTTLLGLSANLVLAYDFDSFTKSGGAIYVEKCFNIMNNAQSSSSNSFKNAGDKKNFYFLVENLQNAQLAPIREGIYKYHRLGLDIFLEKPLEARNVILDVLREMEKIYAIRADAVVLNTFFDTKSNEIISLFKGATPDQKQKAYDLLVRLDPIKSSQYAQLLN